ncbi:MAG: sugar-binding protein [Ignavibacteriaceae bacterium]
MSNKHNKNGLIINAYKAKSPILVDGIIRKNEWHDADSICFNANGKLDKRRSATVYVLWDNRYLYVAFDVDRKNPKAKVTQRDGDGLWLDDGIELLIDGKNDKGKYFMPDDIAYHINILNAVYDDRGTGGEDPDSSWNGKAKHKMKLKNGKDGILGYTCEIAVPWSEIGVKPISGETILGVDFCVNGTDDETGEYHYFDWAGLKLFHYPDGFGQLYLVGPRNPSK